MIQADILQPTRRRRRLTTFSRSSTATPTTSTTSEDCASPATRARARSMMTDGSNNLGSTPTDEPTRWPLSHRSSRTSKMPTSMVFVGHGATSKAWRGVGASNLYDLRTGQRAGPTAYKVPESNKVLTLRALSAVPVRGEIWRQQYLDTPTGT